MIDWLITLLKRSNKVQIIIKKRKRLDKMGVACWDSSAAPPDTRMVPKKGVVAKKDPLEAGDMEMETGDNMQ